jgi:hypothetical protein
MFLFKISQMTKIQEVNKQLTVVCLLWGDKYPHSYVYNLKKMLDSFLTVPHTFICVTNHILPGIETVPLDVSFQYPAWWQKISLFNLIRTPFIYFDLDVLIANNIDYLADYAHYDIAMPSTFTVNVNGFQSSVFASNGNFTKPYDMWEKERFISTSTQLCPYGAYRKKLSLKNFSFTQAFKVLKKLLLNQQSVEELKFIRGDQEYLTYFFKSEIKVIPSGIVSYKIHATEGIPASSSVVCFHGKPDYHEVQSGWVPAFIEKHKLTE